MDEIHFRSQGIPRLINAICDNLLLTAFRHGKPVATLEMLDEVTADMRLEYPGKNPFRPEPNYPEQVLRRPEIRFRSRIRSESPLSAAQRHPIVAAKSHYFRLRTSCLKVLDPKIFRSRTRS